MDELARIDEQVIDVTKATAVAPLEHRLTLAVGHPMVALPGRHHSGRDGGVAVGHGAFEAQLRRLVLLLQRHGERLLLNEAILPAAALAQAPAAH